MTIGKSFNLKTQKNEGINKDFWIHTETLKVFQTISEIPFYRHHIEPRSSILRTKKRIISFSTGLYWWHKRSKDLRHWTTLFWKDMTNTKGEIDEIVCPWRDVVWWKFGKTKRRRKKQEQENRETAYPGKIQCSLTCKRTSRCSKIRRAEVSANETH